MNIAIIDDDQSWVEYAKKEIEKYKDHHEIKVSTYNDGNMFLREKELYDVVFLDVEMPKIDGFEVAQEYKKYNPNVKIVMFSSHLDAEFMQRGYKIDALRYVNKRKLESDISEAMETIIKMDKRNSTITVNVVNEGTFNIKICDIIYIESMGHQTAICTESGSFISTERINSLEEQLMEYGFFRCHKSFIVNFGKIEEYEKNEIRMKDGSRVSLSKRKYAEFRTKHLEYKFDNANS